MTSRAWLCVALLLGCADQPPIAEPPALTDLTLGGVPLVPAFAPDTRSYEVETSLLSHELGLVATSPSPAAVLRVQGPHGQAIEVEKGLGGDYLRASNEFL